MDRSSSTIRMLLIALPSSAAGGVRTCVADRWRGRAPAAGAASPASAHRTSPATRRGPRSCPEARVDARLRRPERLRNSPQPPSARARPRAAPLPSPAAMARRMARIRAGQSSRNRRTSFANSRGLSPSLARTNRSSNAGRPAATGAAGTAAAGTVPCAAAGGTSWSMMRVSSTPSIGFVTYPSMPASRYRSRSPCMACAVSATIGRCVPEARSASRIAAVASSPPITGICTSISTRSNVPRPDRSSAASAAWPSAATST